MDRAHRGTKPSRGKDFQGRCGGGGQQVLVFRSGGAHRGGKVLARKSFQGLRGNAEEIPGLRIGWGRDFRGAMQAFINLDKDVDAKGGHGLQAGAASSHSFRTKCPAASSHTVQGVGGCWSGGTRSIVLISCTEKNSVAGSGCSSK